jgi:hypothetical protein
LIVNIFPLGEYQKLDLITFYFRRESAKTTKNSRPKFIFSPAKFRDYFGQNPENIRKYVLNSDEYKAYKAAMERNRPPSPPEMSLNRLSQADEAPGTDAFDRAAIPFTLASAAPFGADAPEPDSDGTPGAPPGAGARARSCGAAGVAAPSDATPVPPPRSQGEPLPPVIALTARGN